MTDEPQRPEAPESPDGTAIEDLTPANEIQDGVGGGRSAEQPADGDAGIIAVL